MAQNVISERSWPWKVKVIGQQKWHHRILWPQKHRSRHQNCHPNCHFNRHPNLLSAFVQKLWSKILLCIMVADVTHSSTSHIQTTQDIFWFVIRSQHKLPCVKIRSQFVQQEPRYGPKCDFTGLWPWKIKVIREGQNVYYKTPDTYP